MRVPAGPIGETGKFLLSVGLFHSAKPPLSPSFHPHSFVSEIRSVPGGCSRFSRCCYLIIVLFPTVSVGVGPQDLVAVTWTRRLSSAVRIETL
jgi:hypothetical protein